LPIESFSQNVRGEKNRREALQKGAERSFGEGKEVRKVLAKKKPTTGGTQRKNNDPASVGRAEER